MNWCSRKSPLAKLLMMFFSTSLEIWHWVSQNFQMFPEFPNPYLDEEGKREKKDFRAANSLIIQEIRNCRKLCFEYLLCHSPRDNLAYSVGCSGWISLATAVHCNRDLKFRCLEVVPTASFGEYHSLTLNKPQEFWH